MTWPGVAAARGGVELINLGLGGSALLDPFTELAFTATGPFPDRGAGPRILPGRP
jgi:hypothetical protein